MLNCLLAQSIELNNPPSTVSGTSDQELQAAFDVTNVSSTSINVKVKRVILSEIAGSENNFCWGAACYPSFVDELPDYFTLTAGETISTFKGDYKSLENDGETIIQYCFFNVDNIADSTCTIIRFVAMPVGISEKNTFLLSPAFPNPTNDFIGINYKIDSYSVDASISFYNIVGAVVESVKINNTEGTVVFPVNDLKPGIYFYSISSQGRSSATKKFVVK
jgi:hypothetical protein